MVGAFDVHECLLPPKPVVSKNEVLIICPYQLENKENILRCNDLHPNLSDEAFKLAPDQSISVTKVLFIMCWKSELFILILMLAFCSVNDLM